MAWGNLAAVGKLMASLSQFSGGGDWQTKGGGKGKHSNKGKGKAKGKGNGNDKDDACFQCLWDDCTLAQAQKPTWNKPCCHGCNRPKGTAKSPPPERLTQWAYNLKKKENEDKKGNQSKGGGKGTSDKDQSGKNKAATTATPPRTPAAVAEVEKLAELRADRLAGLQDSSYDLPSGASPPRPAQAPKSTAPGKKVPSTLCEGALESAPMVISLIQPVIELVARDWITEVPTNLDVEEDLKKLLQDSHQLSNADDREAIDASLKECRTLLATIASPTARKRLQEQVDSDTAALEKLSKKVGPSRATQLAALQEAQKKLLTQGSERRDKQVSGTQKALARAEARREFFGKIREQLDLV